MSAVFDTSEIDAAHRALTGKGSDELIEYVFRWNMGMPVDRTYSGARETARRLGWIDERSGQFTPLGYLIADSIREYRFWLDRSRRLHSEHETVLLARDYYRGKSLLEVGCGFGCNLLSLADVEGRFVGVEPVSIYRQLTGAFAQRERIPVPEIREGFAEALPFGSGEMDIVLCYSSHQYMDIRIALREMARVLRPGGQLQIVGGTFGAYPGFAAREVFLEGKWGTFHKHALTICNTISYALTGRRLYVPKAAGATVAPIYPPIWLMARWINASNLVYRADLSRRLKSEFLFVADKPA